MMHGRKNIKFSFVRIKNPRNHSAEGPVTVLIRQGKWIGI